LLGCLGRWRAPRDNDLDLQPNQFGGQRGEPIRFPIPVSPLYGQVLPRDVTEFVQPAVQWFESSCRMRGGPGINMPTRGILPYRRNFSQALVSAARPCVAC
jgi:hypothetical protein